MQFIKLAAQLVMVVIAHIFLRVNGRQHCQAVSEQVRIKSWSAVAVWKWITNDTECGICRLPFDGCCPDCRLPGDDCPLVTGRCKHCFHMHCIMKWLAAQQMQQHCPMCRQEWQFSD